MFLKQKDAFGGGCTALGGLCTGIGGKGHRATDA